MTDRADIPIDELVGVALNARLAGLHTAMPGIVQSYDENTECADVQPAVKRVIEQDDGSFTFEALPLISNVKVGWLGAGGFVLHFPLVKGDSVLLVFAEVDTQQWEVSGEVSNPLWLERFGLGSPTAYPFRRTAGGAAGANLVAPTPFVIGNPTSAQLVALANKVDAALASIQSAFDAHTHTVATTGSAAAQTGTAAPVVSPIGSLPATAAVKLKAE